MDAVSSSMENKQEVSITVEELTANDQESQQHEVSEIVPSIIPKRPPYPENPEGPRRIRLQTKCLDLGMMRTKEKFDSNLIYKEEELVAAEMYKDLDLYLAAINGDPDHFKRILDTISESDSEYYILSRLSPIKNTFLHVAAKHGNLDIVKFIASTKPSLVLPKNIHGETVLHLAAKGGHEAMVEALVRILSPYETWKSALLMAVDEMGNTALGQALISGWESVASFLIQQDSELSYHLNKHGESAIYLAAKAGFVECVSSILAQCTDEGRLNLLFKNKSPIQPPIPIKPNEAPEAPRRENKPPIQPPIPVKRENKSPFHVAIQRKEIVVLETIITAKPELIQIRDDEGRNPLHFAASLGHLEATKYLLQKNKSNATRRENKGQLPIHLAALEGHVDVIRALLQCPSQAEDLLDMSGCNILHIAAQSGKYNVFRFVLKNPKLNSLINMKNKYGDTPLHITTRNEHPKIVGTLTWDQRVYTKAVNNEEMTALDVAYEKIENPSFEKRLTWAALKAVSVPQKSDSRRMLNVDLKVYKERVNTLLVVATLVATVTFAAGFTMPGGYISSETGTDLGMATLWSDTVFHVFVLCDTIAMYTSILVVTALIWAQLGDITLVIYALELAAPLLGVALIMMSIAFTAGVTIVVSKLRWLQITLLAMSTFSIALLLLLLLPLCAPITSRNWILRNYASVCEFEHVSVDCGITEQENAADVDVGMNNQVDVADADDIPDRLMH